MEELRVAIERTGEQFGCSSDHFELQHVIDLRTQPVARTAEPPNAQRPADRQVLKLSHHRWREPCRKGRLYQLTPGYARINIGALPIDAMNGIESNGLYDDAVCDLCVTKA